MSDVRGATILCEGSPRAPGTVLALLAHGLSERAHGHLSGPKERGASVVTQTDELPDARMPEAYAGSRGLTTTTLLAVALVGSAIAIVAWLDGSPAVGWAWALWVVAFAALLARLIAGLAVRPS